MLVLPALSPLGRREIAVTVSPLTSPRGDSRMKELVSAPTSACGGDSGDGCSEPVLSDLLASCSDSVVTRGCS